MRFTLGGIQHQIDYRLLDINKIHLGQVALKRLRFTLGKLTPDQVSVQLNTYQQVKCYDRPLPAT